MNASTARIVTKQAHASHLHLGIALHSQALATAWTTATIVVTKLVDNTLHTCIWLSYRSQASLTLAAAAVRSFSTASSCSCNNSSAGSLCHMGCLDPQLLQDAQNRILLSLKGAGAKSQTTAGQI
jgi:hypothetical protein